MRVHALSVLGLGLAMTGCATIERGMHDQVYVVTDPPGAKASQSNSDDTCVTPCRFEVDRTGTFTIAVTMDGYEPQQVEVKTKSVAPQGATSKDLTADYLARVIDDRGGANLIHTPNPVAFKLVKSGG